MIMRLIPALAVAAALMVPVAASAACDQAEMQKLSNEMMTAAQAYAAKNPTVEQQQAMQQRMMEVAQKAQASATGNPEEACTAMQSLIDELNK